MARFELWVNLCRMQQLAFAGVDNQQFAGADTAFFHYFIGRVVPNTHFGSNGNQPVLGDDITRRAQAVAVQIAGSIAPVG